MPHAWSCRAALDQTPLMTSIYVKMCHFPPEDLLPQSVCCDWCRRAQSITEPPTLIHSISCGWWLLHQLQGALSDRSNVCQTEAAMIRNCVWVMLKGCLLTPERFSDPAVATQPNFISFWEKKRSTCLLTGGGSRICCFINVEISKWGILWGQVAEQSTFNCPSTSAGMNGAIQMKLWLCGTSKVGLRFHSLHKNKWNKRSITSRWLILCCVIKSPDLTPPSNITPLCSISSYKYTPV